MWGVEEREAEKLVSCHSKDRGYKLYLCPSCSDDHLVTFGCNSRLCSGCGKPHADRWATDLRRTILPAPHRHLTFTRPEELRPLIARHRDPLFKALMDAILSTLDEALGKILRGPRTKT